MKIHLLAFFILLFSSASFSQKSHCRTLAKDAPVKDTFGLIDKSPYRQNTRANLVFYKKEINHQGCNENDYQPIIFDDFENGFDTTLWQKDYPYTPPYDKTHSDRNKSYLIVDENTYAENGILNLAIKSNNPSYSYLDENGNSKTLYRKYSLGMLHSKETYQGPWSIEAMGCFKFGKFSVRMKFPKSNDFNVAYWFFGGGNEIDVFEMFNGTDNRIRASIHQWNVNTDDNDTHAEYGLNYNLGNLSEKFNTWELEWTPFKISWSINGKTFRVFYKYYKKSIKIQGDEKRVCFIGVDCDEIPIGETTVYELSGWNSFSTRPIDLILGIGITGIPKKMEKVEVDWIKIEQQPNLIITSNNETPCLGEQIILQANHTDQIVDWEVSNNLEIISIEENKLTVISNQDSTIGWVEAKVIGNNIDLPPNNWTTVGYTFFDEFLESAIPFQNFSYSCQDAEMSVRKEIIIGQPINPILEDNLKPCFLYGGFEVKIKNTDQFSPTSNFQWTTHQDAVITENHQSMWVTPDRSLENQFFNFQLDITNSCGTSTFQKEILIPDCEDNTEIPTLVISPNPAIEMLSFILQKTNYEIIPPEDSPYLIVETATGRILKEGNLGEDLHQINVSEWGGGIYKIIFYLKEKKYHSSFSIIR